jgi:Zn-dependent protease
MVEHSFLSSGLRLARVRGIPVFIHWSLLLFFLYDVYKIWVQKIGWTALGYWGAGTIGLFGTILLHELGHCYAAFRMGGGADQIVLWPLGGLAYCDAPRTPRAQFWVAAGGPLVNVAILALLLAAEALVQVAFDRSLVFLENPLWPGARFYDIRHWALRYLFQLNLSLLIFNLLPIYPLDGGRIFQTIAWARTGSYGRGSLLTVWVSRGALLVLLVLSFFPPLEGTLGPLTFFILLWAFLHTEQLKHRIREESEDYVFGYDFSRGYTSLERAAGAAGEKKRRGPGFLERLRLRRAVKRQAKILAMRQRVDALLAKISSEGMQSLSASERRELEEASRRLRQS